MVWLITFLKLVWLCLLPPSQINFHLIHVPTQRIFGVFLSSSYFVFSPQILFFISFKSGSMAVASDSQWVCSFSSYLYFYCSFCIFVFVSLFLYICIFVFPPPILLHISFNSGPMAVGRKQKWELSHKLMPKHWTCIYRGKMPKCKMHYFLSAQLFLGHHHLPHNRASQISSLSSGYLWSRNIRTMQLVFILTLLDATIHL